MTTYRPLPSHKLFYISSFRDTSGSAATRALASQHLQTGCNFEVNPESRGPRHSPVLEKQITHQLTTEEKKKRQETPSVRSAQGQPPAGHNCRSYTIKSRKAGEPCFLAGGRWQVVGGWWLVVDTARDTGLQRSAQVLIIHHDLPRVAGEEAFIFQGQGPPVPPQFPMLARRQNLLEA